MLKKKKRKILVILGVSVVFTSVSVSAAGISAEIATSLSKAKAIESNINDGYGAGISAEIATSLSKANGKYGGAGISAEVARILYLEKLEKKEEKVEPELKKYRELLAQLMMQEARGTSFEEMLYVGCTAINRMYDKNEEFKNVNNLWEVVAQKGQYPTTWAKIQAGEISPDEMAYKAADWLIENRPVYMPNGEAFDSGIVFQRQKPYNGKDVYLVFKTKWHYYSKIIR